MTNLPRSIVAAALATVACVLLATLVPVTAPAAIGAVPLVLFLPGWAVVVAIDPHRTLLDGKQRIFWAAATSLVVAVVGGLFLNEVTSLDRPSWVVLLACFVAFLLGVGLFRIRRNPTPEVAAEADPVDRPPGTNLGRRLVSSISLRSALLLCAALGLVIGALALSQNSVTANNPNFIELWMLPVPLSAGAAAPVAQIGVQNQAGSDIDIVVRVSEGSHRLFSRTIRDLAPNATWTHSVRRHATQKIAATVSYASQPGHVVRSVDLKRPTT